MPLPGRKCSGDFLQEHCFALLSPLQSIVRFVSDLWARNCGRPAAAQCARCVTCEAPAARLTAVLRRAEPGKARRAYTKRRAYRKRAPASAAGAGAGADGAGDTEEAADDPGNAQRAQALGSSSIWEAIELPPRKQVRARGRSGLDLGFAVRPARCCRAPRPRATARATAPGTSVPHAAVSFTLVISCQASNMHVRVLRGQVTAKPKAEAGTGGKGKAGRAARRPAADDCTDASDSDDVADDDMRAGAESELLRLAVMSHLRLLLRHKSRTRTAASDQCSGVHSTVFADTRSPAVLRRQWRRRRRPRQRCGFGGRGLAAQRAAQAARRARRARRRRGRPPRPHAGRQRRP